MKDYIEIVPRKRSSKSDEVRMRIKKNTLTLYIGTNVADQIHVSAGDRVKIYYSKDKTSLIIQKVVTQSVTIINPTDPPQIKKEETGIKILNTSRSNNKQKSLTIKITNPCVGELFYEDVDIKSIDYRVEIEESYRIPKVVQFSSPSAGIVRFLILTIR